MTKAILSSILRITKEYSITSISTKPPLLPPHYFPSEEIFSAAFPATDHFFRSRITFRPHALITFFLPEDILNRKEKRAAARQASVERLTEKCGSAPGRGQKSGLRPSEQGSIAAGRNWIPGRKKLPEGKRK